jgi:hypothetical protein
MREHLKHEVDAVAEPGTIVADIEPEVGPAKLENARKPPVPRNVTWWICVQAMACQADEPQNKDVEGFVAADLEVLNPKEPCTITEGLPVETVQNRAMRLLRTGEHASMNAMIGSHAPSGGAIPR